MKTIWKYPIDITDWQRLDMPANPVLLHAGLDPSGALCVWAIVEPEAPVEAVYIRIIGTGQHPTDFQDMTQHLGTVVQNEFVWHIFRETP